MPSTILQKAETYKALHTAPGTFVAGGCWDAGTAMLLAHVGLQLVETSSAGVMFARGLPDGDGLATRELMLENARSIAAAVGIPVTADLENGFGASPEVVAETIRLAGQTGIVGGSIEDTTGDRTDPFYPLGLAVDRIRAAAEAARGLPFPFALTARADQYLHGRPDLAETVRRAQAFQEAGADMILTPGITGREEIETLCPLGRLPGRSHRRIVRLPADPCRVSQAWCEAGDRWKLACTRRVYRVPQGRPGNAGTRNLQLHRRTATVRRTQ